MSDGRGGPDLGVGPRLEPSWAPAAAGRQTPAAPVRVRVVDAAAVSDRRECD